MTENELKNLLAAVTPPDEAARAAAHAHWAALAKPLGGLGRLEAMVEAAAALTGDPVPDVSRRAVLVLCADNGVVAQGVSQTDASVTLVRPTATSCPSIWALRAHPCPARRTAALLRARLTLPPAQP